MKNIEKQIAKTIRALIESGARTATLYVSERGVVRASRRMYGKQGKRKFGKDSVEFVVTVGRPNYEGREFVKKAKKAGEPFPIKRVQLRFPAR